MDKEQAYQKCESFIGEFDELISSVKSIKNYMYSSFCTDFLSGMYKKRNSVFDLLNVIYNLSNENFNSSEIERKLTEIERQVENAKSELEFIKTKGPFKNPY